MTDKRTGVDPAAEKLAAECAAAMYERDSAARDLGIRIREVGEGRSVLSMVVRTSMLNGHNVCHGGYIFTLADTAFAYACNSRNAVNLAQSASIDFIAPAYESEELIATAAQHFQADRSGLYDVSVCRANGDLVAEFRGRSYRIRGSVIPARDADPESSAT